MRSPKIMISMAGSLMLAAGCCHPSVTAVPLSPWNQCGKQEGIPYYLPKPLLVISKNVRYIEEAKVGLTSSVPIPGGFDDQARYADVNARTQFEGTVGTPSTTTITNNNTAAGGSAPVLHSSSEIPMSPIAAPKDGLSPDVFYTYQIVFIPDLSQKYGLKVKGGVGEIRAAMSMVNGWMFTGLGPYYMKDSSTAQNLLAGGISSKLALGGVGDVIKSVADLRKVTTPGSPRSGELDDKDLIDFTKNISRIEKCLSPEKSIGRIDNYAEIHVYEPVLNADGTTEWRQIANHSFDRPMVSQGSTTMIHMKDKPAEPLKNAPAIPSTEKPGGGNEPRSGDLSMDDMSRRIVERQLGLAPGVLPGGNQPRSGELASNAPGGVNVFVNPPLCTSCPNPPGVLKSCVDKLCRRPVNQTSFIAGATEDVTGPVPVRLAPGLKAAASEARSIVVEGIEANPGRAP